MSYQTEQEDFWAGDFGNQYVERNDLSAELVAARTACWAEMLRKIAPIESAFEVGCNRGLNLVALKHLQPHLKMNAIEINTKAAEIARTLNIADIKTTSLFDFEPKDSFDLVLVCGVLIHLNPDRLREAYEKIFKLSKKSILLFEYYNPSPVEVNYRGHEGRLFKRDWAGEMLDQFKGKLKLVDYGFFYHRDPVAWSDDGNWFVLEKV
jgi:spore coat polysaccharide biosynthesis protein SpsF